MKWTLNQLYIRRSLLLHKQHSWRKEYYLFAFLALFSASAVISASFWPDDQDGVNCLLGIDQYDLAFHQPHFPGYPVYIAVGKLFTFLTASPEKACIFFSILSGSFCLLIIYFFVRKNFARQTAILCVFALAVHPVFFEFSHKIFTEMPALCLLLLAVFIIQDTHKASDSRWFAGGITMGVMLGIRLSWWPYPFFYLVSGYMRKKGYAVVSGFLIGVLLWFIPQAAIAGISEFFSIGLSFTYGHFTQWGGAAGSRSGIGERFFSCAIRLVEIFGWHGSGIVYTRFPWIAFTLFCFINVWQKKKQFSGKLKPFLTATMFYLIWVILGQNTDNLRHFIPLLPALIFFISPVVFHYPKAASMAFVIFSLTLPLNYASRNSSLPPAVQFKQWIDSFPDSDAVFYCGNSERLFDRYHSTHRVISVTHMDNLDFTVQSTWPVPSSAFSCDDIPDFKTDKKPIVIFHKREGDPVDRSLSIYARE